MRIIFASIALALSGLLYVWFGAIFLYPVYVLGWAEGWRTAASNRAWLEWAAIAGIAITATVLLAVGVSLLNNTPRHESD